MPFKSDKQRGYLFANEPEIAKKWAKEYRAGGAVRDMKRDMSLRDYSVFRAGGLIRDGAKCPKGCKNFQDEAYRKASKES